MGRPGGRVGQAGQVGRRAPSGGACAGGLAAGQGSFFLSYPRHCLFGGLGAPYWATLLFFFLSPCHHLLCSPFFRVACANGSRWLRRVASHAAAGAHGSVWAAGQSPRLPAHPARVTHCRVAPPCARSRSAARLSRPAFQTAATAGRRPGGRSQRECKQTPPPALGVCLQAADQGGSSSAHRRRRPPPPLPPPPSPAACRPPRRGGGTGALDGGVAAEGQPRPLGKRESSSKQ